MRFAFLRVLKTMDDYGHPIQLTYKGEETYQSAFGGLLTVGVQIMTLAMTTIALMEVLQMMDPKITQYSRPLSESDREEIGDINF